MFLSVFGYVNNRVCDRLFNWSAHADTQQQVAVARQLLRSGGLQRYLA